jgi:hypothetical protein
VVPGYFTNPLLANCDVIDNRQNFYVTNAIANDDGIFSIKSVLEGDYTLTAADRTGIEQGAGELKVQRAM